MSGKSIFIAFVVSLGGFLFGFDAGIISGVMDYAGPQFALTDAQWGWVVSSPSFAAMFAMLVSGRISDVVGRKKILILVAFFYALSALLSAYAISYQMLYLARMIGGLAFGAALILAPTYIAEISIAKNRGKLVSIQQLNIVLGFFAAFLCNNYLNSLNSNGESFLTDENVWRWMLGIELIPALLYFLLLFFVPKSPRWLFVKNKTKEAVEVLEGLYGKQLAESESKTILESINQEKNKQKVAITELFMPGLRFILIVGLAIGVLQQITGINAIYFYATSIFKQTGIGTDAAFTSGVLLSFTTVVFTIVAMFLIDKMGRRPLMIIGIGGIAVSLLLCAYGFNNATYQLTSKDISAFEEVDQTKLSHIVGVTFDSDVDFKNEMKLALGNQEYAKKEGAILEAAIDMNASLVLIGILGFIACFAFSLGPVMWVMLSEMYPNNYRGLAIGFIGFVNSFASWLVQQVFPWELSNLGNAMSFLIFGVIALVGFFVLLKILPETKGKSLEELEKELVKA
ncbi:sugar porter family MFS transporter [Aquimarina sp. D1M17]|uniref:sugar porter family MFS transporter n=1 Tax=Aquimarina acroporae TaxID=2937283 RepID=UPI0020C173C0|nr:sugar porter family MFS transporter [Aquimarina acroporae]MCK8521748.1 sugar porter family MFS transporter [Aquimarina acroporae]